MTPIPHKRIWVSAALVTASLLLPACNASQTSSSTSTSTFDPATVQVDDALAAKVPAGLKSKGTLVFASDATYAPAESLGGADGQTPVGYDIDIAKAIGATLGLKVQINTAEFTGILPAVGPKYDLGISSFTINQERLKSVNMVSYLSAGTQWAVKKGNPKNFGLDDICGKSVGVQTGTVQEEPDVQQRSADCVKAGRPAINIMSLKTQTDVTTRLVNGGLDAMAADSPVIGYALAQTNGQLESLGEIYDAAPQGIAVAKPDTELASLVSEAINRLIANGTYRQILEASKVL